VTYQIHPIQAMISEIDLVLRQTRSRKFWTVFRHRELQRQLLERCRNFLVMQQRPGGFSDAVQLIPATSSASSSAESQREMTLEIQRLRQEVIHPLRSDVAALSSQRSALQEDIQTLMFQKAQLQADCETARLNLAQTVPVTPQKAISNQVALDEAELARLQALRERSDFLLTSLDSSLQLAFSAMQKNVEVYQSTLHSGLDRMHHLGYQGEVLFSTLVNRLAQQVGREMAIALPETTSPIRPTPSPSDTKKSPMNESIDFFFADVDPAIPVANVDRNNSSHVPTSSKNPIPQQVDVNFNTPSLDRSWLEVSSEQSDLDHSITLDSLFDSDESTVTTIDEPEMTLAEMDQLFADVPSL
jgi:hypothetical protein